jgi:membrane-associated phospholipid phosphatase
MTRIAVLVAALWVGCTPAAFAQNSSLAGAIAHTVANDLRHVFTPENGLILGGASGLALAIVPHEHAIVRLSTLADGMDDAFHPADALGHGLTQLGGATALYVTGRLTGRSRLETVGRQLMRAQAVNGTLTHALKFAVRRRRPDGGAHSFPSGHTSAAFTTATVLQHELGWKAGAPAYLVASYIGTARAAANKHYVSDLIVGAAVGVVSARAVATLPGTHRSITITPVVGRDAAGMMLTWISHP